MKQHFSFFLHAELVLTKKNHVRYTYRSMYTCKAMLPVSFLILIWRYFHGQRGMDGGRIYCFVFILWQNSILIEILIVFWKCYGIRNDIRTKKCVFEFLDVSGAFQTISERNLWGILKSNLSFCQKLCSDEMCSSDVRTKVRTLCWSAGRTDTLEQAHHVREHFLITNSLKPQTNFQP